jgi:hypothetical protein
VLVLATIIDNSFIAHHLAVGERTSEIEFCMQRLSVVPESVIDQILWQLSGYRIFLLKERLFEFFVDTMLRK